jgi:tRNA modification GTPase
VIRISGPAAPEVLCLMAGGVPQPRQAALRSLLDPATGEVIDQALVLFLPGPRSATGEDLAEFQVHGGRAVVSSVLAALARIPGCRMAEPGEFARRAFDNGKLDLTAVEGLADLIDAETEGQRRQALRQASGGLAKLYEDWRSQLIEAAALVEAGIDFSDEADVSAKAFDMARERVARLDADMRRHLDDGHRGEIMREGFRVVLAGPPNVGKSSLLNALARRDVAIVSPEPGTTRDVIEVRLDLGGVPVVVSDTAGIRVAEGEVEREGIRRTMDRAREADLVIWLMDATAVEPPADLVGWVSARGRGAASPGAGVTRHLGAASGDREGPPGYVGLGAPEIRGHDTRAAMPLGAAPSKSWPRISGALTQPTERGLLHVRTKIDLEPQESDSKLIAVSSRTGAGLGKLTSHIAALAAERAGSGDEAVITQARQRQLIEACAACLADFLSGDPAHIELRAEDLRRAAHALGRITGRVDVEDVLDQVFSRFCIGK